ncbi:MAG: LPS export ABC transporter ATP-binding protein [Thermoguttaceae bacterium]|nr:LPS export ABC transporter ATP-binding protein [Thermoguttaceae bacterium]
MTPKPRPKRPEGRRERAVVLKAEGLVKKYGERTVVKGVSFEVREGEVVGLLGANGAGKTTSFRMSCGLIPTNGGRVLLNGLDVTDWPMYRRAREGRLGYLPQDRSAFAALTTEQNLYAAMEFLGYSRSEQKRRCEESLKRFNLLHIRKTKVGAGGSGGLSGGERRRLEIARALLADPKILLLDEPFANVDPITVEELQKVIRELSSDGVAILITDHQVQETLDITDRSYIINAGEVLCSGAPLEVLDNELAVKLYFGGNATYVRERILKKLGGVQAARSEFPREPGAVPRVEPAPPPPEDRRTFDFERTVPTEPAKRPVLGLRRRPDEETRRAPSPKDEPREPNRYESKLGRLLPRRRDE